MLSARLLDLNNCIAAIENGLIDSVYLVTEYKGVFFMQIWQIRLQKSRLLSLFGRNDNISLSL